MGIPFILDSICEYIVENISPFKCVVEFCKGCKPFTEIPESRREKNEKKRKRRRKREKIGRRELYS